MKILYGKAPIYDRAIKIFGPVVSGAIFCWGDTIYTLSEKSITPEILEHEKFHSYRQKQVGLELWWDKYFENQTFRLDEELPAHAIEYLAYCKTKRTRLQRRIYLNGISQRLSGPLYGKILSFEKAKALIKHGAKVYVDDNNGTSLGGRSSQASS